MTESASELAFDTRFSNLNFNKACRALRQERNRTKSFWQGWGGLFVIALGIGAVAGAASGAGRPGCHWRDARRPSSLNRSV